MKVRFYLTAGEQKAKPCSKHWWLQQTVVAPLAALTNIGSWCRKLTVDRGLVVIVVDLQRGLLLSAVSTTDLSDVVTKTYKYYTLGKPLNFRCHHDDTVEWWVNKSQQSSMEF